MELLTVTQRDGEPVACAYGVEQHGSSTLLAGLLFVRAGLTDTDLLFEDPTTRETRRLRLPQNTLGLPQDGFLRHATLEAL